MFFDGEISPDHIRDLSGAGNVRESFAPDGIYAMDRMLNNYIHVLMKREKIYRGLEGVSGDDIFFPTLQEMSDELIDEMHGIDEMLAWKSEMDLEGKKLKESLREINKMSEKIEGSRNKYPEISMTEEVLYVSKRRK